MDVFKGFTGVSSKRGRIYGLTLVMLLMVLLAGCGNNVTTIDSGTPGFFNHYVVYPLSYSMQHIAGWFGGSYGMAIIVLTLIVRFALLPFMMRQAKSQQAMKRVMSRMQPELDALKKRYENKKEREEQQKMQQEMMELYKKHNFNPLNIGCLPILIQLPILSGMYTAIRLTPELSTHSFLWFKLGHPDWIMAIIVAALYLVQAKLSQKTMTPEQQKQMALMAYISPIMMAFFSFSAPAAMPLYWMVSGTFLILQTLLFQRMYPVDAAPVVEEAAAIEAEALAAIQADADTAKPAPAKSSKKRKNNTKASPVK
ncbi:membrane protein insertase YidC [Paenibacillus hunanensis]|uniref:membrane protein insertase YidC n=1 Tax=Paenibacillus hunanensis TaxID=539262 RepID=UPI002025BA7C|nr:membrane protein insertase YidC [Paenibacillus hunanensis]MCL9662234.1 membrane protein insertase YidC [Paenibacillus hunanensis]